MKTESTTPDTATLLEFMFRLGQAYIACGEQTAKVELTLRRTASACGMRKSRVVALSTAVFIQMAHRNLRLVAVADRAGRVLYTAREKALNRRP